MEGVLEDTLNFENDKKIKEEIHNEKIIYSGVCTKKNKFGINQSRNLVVTEKSLYNFNGKSLKREFNINKIRGITAAKKADEFIIHGNSEEYDYHIISKDRVRLIKAIEKVYENLNHEELKFTIYDGKISQLAVTSAERKKVPSMSKMPEEPIYDIIDFIETGGNTEICVLKGEQRHSAKNKDVQQMNSNFVDNKANDSSSTSKYENNNNTPINESVDSKPIGGLPKIMHFSKDNNVEKTKDTSTNSNENTIIKNSNNTPKINIAKVEEKKEVKPKTNKIPEVINNKPPMMIKPPEKTSTNKEPSNSKPLTGIAAKIALLQSFMKRDTCNDTPVDNKPITNEKAAESNIESVSVKDMIARMQNLRNPTTKSNVKSKVEKVQVVSDYLEGEDLPPPDF